MLSALDITGFPYTCKSLGTTHPLLHLANQKALASVKRDKYVSYQFTYEWFECIQYNLLRLYCHFIVTSDNVVVPQLSLFQHLCFTNLYRFDIIPIDSSSGTFISSVARLPSP